MFRFRQPGECLLISRQPLLMTRETIAMAFYVPTKKVSVMRFSLQKGQILRFSLLGKNRKVCS